MATSDSSNAERSFGTKLDFVSVEEASPEDVASYINHFVSNFCSDDRFRHPERLVAFIKTLRRYAGNDDVLRCFKNSLVLPAQRFQSACLGIEEITEKIIARAYLDGHTDWLEERLQKAFAPYSNEARLLASRGETVHIFGSGAAPITALVYFAVQGTRAICVDSDGEALALSREVVQKRLGHQMATTHFAFVEADARHLSVGGRDIRRAVIVAHCLKKREIFENLQRQFSEDVRILIRPPKGLYGYVYEALSAEDLVGFRKLQTTTADSRLSQMLSAPVLLTRDLSAE